MTSPHAFLRRDDGRVSLFVAVLAVGILALIGLAIDGGAKMRAIERADNLAAEAARAGGQAINAPQAIAGGQKVIDPDLAAAAANSYLTTAGVTGTATPSDDGRQLHVTVTITSNTMVLSIIGITSITVTGTATAVLLTG
ncbi:MAG: hypothetical protein V7603_5090 [Micromonosporaceae bacterium]